MLNANVSLSFKPRGLDGQPLIYFNYFSMH